MKKGSTHRNTWKRFERIVASFFGSRRTPLSGSNSGHNTQSDTLHPDIYVEAKFRSDFSVYTLFQDTKKKAKAENKIPVVALKKKGTNGFLLLIEMDDLTKLSDLKKLSNE